MKRPSLVQALSVLLAASLAVALLGALGDAEELTRQALRVALLTPVILFVAPALTIGSLRDSAVVSRGLGRAARITGLLAVVLGSALAVLMVIGMALSGTGALISIFYIVVGAFALHRVARTRDSWVDGPPARAYLGPAIAGTVTLVVLTTTLFKASPWAGDRLTVGVDLEHLVTAERMILSDSGHYSVAPGTARFRPMPGVVGPEIVLTADGFIARAGHRRLSFECIVYVGSTPPADVARIDWMASHEPHPQLRPREVGCFRGSEQDRDNVRHLLLLSVALLPALVGVWAAWGRG